MTLDRQRSQRAHRRAVRREILLPFAGGLILIVVLVVIAASQGATPTSGVANTMLTLLVLCPLALCLIPLYLLLVLAVVGMNRAHNGIAKPLRALENTTFTLRDRTYSISDRLARASINLNARFAPLDRLIFSYFDRPAQNEDDDE
jgi:high-affinity K+ transport system ATPase subunit B